MAARRSQSVSWEWLERELVKRIGRAEGARPIDKSLLRLLADRPPQTRRGRRTRDISMGRQSR